MSYVANDQIAFSFEKYLSAPTYRTRAIISRGLYIFLPPFDIEERFILQII